MGYFKSQDSGVDRSSLTLWTTDWFLVWNSGALGLRERWNFGSAGTSGAQGLRERRDFGSAGTSES